MARRLFGFRRIGHAGTLDPLAEGVLPLCLGRATRLADRLAGGVKVYYGELLLGVITSTDDLEGEVLSTTAPAKVDSTALRSVFERFKGRILQRPPAFSAIKQGGVPAYRRARRGAVVDLAPRLVDVHDIVLVGWDGEVARVLVRCGKGAYIRALARDIGQELGCGGTLQRLVRLQVGRFQLADAFSPDELHHAAASNTLREAVMPVDYVLDDLPALVLDDAAATRARHGQTWPGEPSDQPDARAYDERGELIGLVSSSPEAEGGASWRLRLLLDEDRDS